MLAFRSMMDLSGNKKVRSEYVRRARILQGLGFFFAILALASFMVLCYINYEANEQVRSSVLLRDSVVLSPKKKVSKKAPKKAVKGAEQKADVSFVDKYLLRQIDFNTLQKENPDFDLWLSYPESSLDFPVVMEREVGKYHYDMINFHGKWTGAGTPLIPKSPTGRDFRTLILAHRMVNYWGEEDYLFSNLPNRWMDKETALSHPYVYTYKDNKAFRWRIWTGLPVRGDDKIYQTPYAPMSKEYEDLISHVAAIAPYTIGETPTSLTPTLMLSTCSRAADEVNIGRYCAVFVMDQIYDQKTGSLLYAADEVASELWKIENEKIREGVL